jgi:hypothetical protein
VAKVIVYAGPTISAAEVHAVLPEAQPRPPAARGDLLAEQWAAGDVAVVIDGYFRQRRSVGHKEILRLLSAGVRVIGAASMGALRAAELAPCGMQGVGEVYRMYADGEIDGDDEVGMLHGPAERGYPAQTVALVNLRYGCRMGADLPAGSAARIVAAAKELPFIQRGWPELARVVGAGDQETLRTLERRIGSGEWDLKRRDARAGLRAVHSAGPPAPVDVAFTGISEHQVLTRRSRREYLPGRWMSDVDVLTAARLFDPEYPQCHERVLSGLLTGFGDAAGATAGDYAYEKLGVDALGPLPGALADWLTGAEAAQLSRGEQVRLVMVRVWPVWQSADWRPAAVAAVRASGRWDEWAELVVRADEVAEQTRYRLAVPPPAICAKLFLRHWRRPGTTVEIEMARRGFAGPEELGAAVRRFFPLDMRSARR